MTFSTDHIQQMARTYDREWYALSLFLPPAQREVWWALLAFHAEVAHIPHATTTPDTALLRCVWWRDSVLDVLAGKPAPPHPTLQALAHVMPELPAESAPWVGMCEAMGGWFTEDAPEDWDGLARFAQAFYGPLFSLVCALDKQTMSDDVATWGAEMGTMLGLLKERERIARVLMMPRPALVPAAFLIRLQEARSSDEASRIAEEEMRNLLIVTEGQLAKIPNISTVAGEGNPSSTFIQLNVYLAKKKLLLHKSCKFNELSYRISRKQLTLLGGLSWHYTLTKF